MKNIWWSSSHEFNAAELTIVQAVEFVKQHGQQLSRPYLTVLVGEGKIKARRITDPTGHTYWMLERTDLERFLSSMGKKKQKGKDS